MVAIRDRLRSPWLASVLALLFFFGVSECAAAAVCDPGGRRQAMYYDRASSRPAPSRSGWRLPSSCQREPAPLMAALILFLPLTVASPAC